MIKLNTPYIIENNDVVTFEEGKKGSITGTYGDGTLTGTLEGNLLKATFHNTKANATGLMAYERKVGGKIKLYKYSKFNK